MKKLIYPLLAIVFLAPLSLSAVPSTPQPSSQAAREKNVPPDLVDQIDDTDAYAIPLDDSEEEERVEEERLERLQKKLKKNTTTPAKTPSTTQK